MRQCAWMELNKRKPLAMSSQKWRVKVWRQGKILLKVANTKLSYQGDTRAPNSFCKFFVVVDFFSMLWVSFFCQLRPVEILWLWTLKTLEEIAIKDTLKSIYHKCLQHARNLRNGVFFCRSVRILMFCEYQLQGEGAFHSMQAFS